MSSSKLGHRQRLRERFIAGEGISRTDEALLELLLCYAIPQRDVQPLAQGLLAQFGSLENVLAADLGSLCQHEGVGMPSAVLLKLVEAIRAREAPCGSVLIDSPSVQPEPIPAPPEAEPSAAGTPELLPEPSRIGLAGTATGSNVQPALPIVVEEEEAGEPETRAFNNELVEESMALLAEAYRFGTVEEWRRYMVDALPQNSFNVRRRNANYIINRFAPKGQFQVPLVEFARQFAGTPALRQVVYYQFCLAERLLGDLVAGVFWPHLEIGAVSLQDVGAFLAEVHPLERYQRRMINNCVRTLRNFGIVTSDKGADPVRFTAPPIELPAFAYVVHHAMEAPCMRHISFLAESWAAKVMLWRPSGINTALREAMRTGLIAKISEIDGIRQFTTDLSLADAVRRLS